MNPQHQPAAGPPVAQPAQYYPPQPAGVYAAQPMYPAYGMPVAPAYGFPPQPVYQYPIPQSDPNAVAPVATVPPAQPRARRGERLRDDAFDYVEKELTMSSELIEKLPKFVRDWQPDHVQAWLEEIYSGTKDLPNYLKSFRDLGVRGIDLLAAEDEDLESFGITVPLHVARARTCINQLRNDQKRKEDIASIEKTEQRFTDLKEKYEKLKNRIPAYVLPRKIEFWKTLDLFTFLKQQEDTDEDVSMFLKPFALQNVHGRRLNELRGKDSWETEVSGLVATERDIKTLKGLLTVFERKEEDRFRRLMEVRKRKQKAGLVTILRDAVKLREVIDQGSSGKIYFGYYEKKKVSVKILKIKSEKKAPSSQAETQEELAATQAKELKQYERRIADLIYEAKFTHEAYKACGSGVVKLIGISIDTISEPLLVMQYLCNMSVEREIHAADADNDESIFHAGNERNILNGTNGVQNPVLLQVVRIARDVASALAKLHSVGIIHLDIAARNILLDVTKRPKIADFGGAAMEADLLQLYELKKRIIDEGTRMYKDDDELQVDCEISRDMLNTERSLIDDNTLKIYDMPPRDRYVRHMPLWVVDSGEHNNPLLDRHTDVYAFGCFMYELVTHKVPHSEINANSPEDIIEKKLSGAGNPTIPASVDPRFARLMASCWEDYDEQPSMANLCRELTELHTLMATESTPESQSYNQFRDLVSQTNQPTAERPTFSAVPTRRASVRGKPSIGDDMIRLAFPENLKIEDDERILEYQGVGIRKNKLEDSVLCALRHRDHNVLVLHLQCICIENRDIQIEMINLCFDYLSMLADDEHSSTDEEGTWQSLCESVVQVLNTALCIFTPSSPERGNIDLDPRHQADILRHGLPAISALLGRKTLDEDSPDEDNDVFSGALVNGLCELVKRILMHFQSDATVVESAATVIARLVELTPIAMRQLHSAGIVSTLIRSMKEHSSIYTTVLQCVKALGAFPLRTLLEPQPVSNTTKDRVFVGKMTAAKAQEAVDNLSRNWNAVLQSVVEVIHNCVSALKNTQGNAFLFAELMDLLEACCLMIFRSCEACSLSEQDVIERFFYSADKGTVAAFVSAISAAPDNFRIQEGGIGALGHLLSTGDMLFTDANKMHLQLIGSSLTPVMIVPRVLTADERIAVYLELDPSLKLLLAAMDKFRVNDKIAVGIVTSTQTATRKNSTATMSKYAPLTQTTSRTASQMTATTMIDSFNRGQEEAIIDALQFDKDGERRTAASIQSNVAIVIGLSCAHHKDVQQNLVRSRYNDMILTSFRNFRNDKCLVEYGCRAFYWTCRRNTMHQLMLMERQILKQLLSVLQKFSDDWSVLDAVICTVLGLLEPPDEAYIPQFFPGASIDEAEIRKKRPEVRENCTGLKVVQELLKNRGDGESVFEFITLRVFEFIPQPNTDQLVANYLRLVTCIMYWSPNVVVRWINDGVVNFAKNKATMTNILINVMIHRLGREVGTAKAQEVNSKKVKEKNSTSASKSDAEKKTASTASTNSKDITSRAQENKTKRASALIMEEFEKKNNAADTACILTLHFVIEEIDIALKEFVTITVNWHDSAPDVLAAGLGIILQLYQAIILNAESNNNTKYPIGAVLPYTNVENLVIMRRSLIQYGFIDHCLYAKEHQLDHPILIRYSLWILLLFISEPKQDDDALTPDNPCSDICQTGAPEWVVEVAKRYGDFYSLQSLCFMFLVRAEEQGAFINRSFETLEEMRECAIQARDRPIDSFKAFADEGADTYLIGQPLIIFGELPVHADRLLRAIDRHLTPLPNVATGFSAAFSPGVPFVDIVKTVSPINITVTSAETEENEAGERFIAYSLLVQWNTDVKWTVSYRYVYFRELWEDLDKEFSHLEPMRIEDLGKLNPLQTLWKKDPVLLEGRKRKLQDFFDSIRMTRAKLFSPRLLDFLKVSQNVESSMIAVPRRLDDILPSDHNFSVNAICVDEILGVTIVGCGHLSSSFFDRDSAKVRGSITVYLTSEKEARSDFGDSANLMPVKRVFFNSGVTALAWDSRRRCVCVGFLSGAVSFYFLTEDNALNYVSEFDFHSGKLCHLSYDPVRQSLLSLSVGGMLAAYDMNEGLVTSQTAKCGANFTCGAYDTVNNIAICGTTSNSVLIFNLNNNPPGSAMFIHRFPSEKPAPVLSVAYVEFTRLLYVAFLHQVHIFKLSGSASTGNIAMNPWTTCPVLGLNPVVMINNVATFHDGNFVYLSTTSGGIAVFDMRNSITVTASAPAAATTAKAAVLPWSEVITRDCSEICDWLRATGINASSASNRTELIRLVKSSVPATSDEISTVLLRNADPKKQVMFSWKLESTVGSKTMSSTALSMSYVDLSRAILVGTDHGKLCRFNVSNFFAPFSSLDPQQLSQHIAAFPRVITTKEHIHGSTKTSRAKRHELSR